jgi:IclR family pca regulon transcriptional regulator
VSHRPKRTPAATGAQGERAAPWLEVIDGAPRYSVSLAVGLAILESLTAEHPVLGIAEIADVMGLRGRSTTHRYASTLAVLGYLEQDRSRRYRLAPKAANLALALLDSMPLRAAAREHVRGLRDRTGYTTGLVILDGPDVLYTERFSGHRRGQWAVDDGIGVATRLPAHLTAGGKALLAGLPTAERTKLLQGLRSVQQATGSVTSNQRLGDELAQIHEERLALSDQELREGLRSIAIPLADTLGDVLAAIEIAVPAGAFTSMQALAEHLAPALTETAGKILLATKH